MGQLNRFITNKNLTAQWLSHLHIRLNCNTLGNIHTQHSNCGTYPSFSLTVNPYELQEVCAGHKMCISRFCTAFLKKNSCSVKDIKPHSKCTETHVDLHAKCLLLFNFNCYWKSPQYRFHENPFSSYQVVTCGQIDTAQLIITPL